MSTKKASKEDFKRMLRATFVRNSTIQDRLAALKLVLGTQKDLAAASGVSVGAVKNWLGDRASEPGLMSMTRLSRKSGASLDYLGEGRLLNKVDRDTENLRLSILSSQLEQEYGEHTAPIIREVAAELLEEAAEGLPDPSDADFVYVRRLDINASAGAGALVEHPEPRGTIAFTRDWMRRKGITPEAAEVLTSVGDSMEPTIRDGDLLLIDRSIDRVVDNGIYVIVLAGMVMLKRLQIRADGGLMISSDNERYLPETIGPEAQADLVVEGRVRWFGRTI